MSTSSTTWNPAISFWLLQLLAISANILFLKNADWKMNGEFYYLQKCEWYNSICYRSLIYRRGMGNCTWDLKLYSLGIFSAFQKRRRLGQNFIIFG
jgi:hypothetical protein